MQEVKICVDDHGVLVAVYPDGTQATILVDVYESSQYGILLVDRLYNPS